VVYTKENETGDTYIEKFVTKIGKNDRVRVITSDGLIQLTAVRIGVQRVSAREFEGEVDRVYDEIGEVLDELKKDSLGSIGEIMEQKEKSGK